jgi:hypothetical protein
MTHAPDLEHASFVAWAAEGHKDSMGLPFSDWLLCRFDTNGRALRDRDGRQVYETQAEWLARNGMPTAATGAPVQRALFA